MLPCICSVIGNIRTSLFCSYHILPSSVIYYWTDARQHRIYLLYIIKRQIVQHCAWWRYFSPMTRKLCQKALLFKFVFSIGNKETIGKNQPDNKGHWQHSGPCSKMMPSWKWPMNTRHFNLPLWDNHLFPFKFQACAKNGPPSSLGKWCPICQSLIP